MKKNVCLILACLMICLAAVSCSGKKTDYLVLVNKENKLPDNWEETLDTLHMTNSLGDDVEVEKEAYDAYLKLKEALLEEDVRIDLDSARRSVAAQQEIVDSFTEKYGEDYVKRYVAVPGYSEHHTGLALDLYLNIDGKDVYLNEDMVEYPEIWEKIHAKLAEFGFILRYLEGKEAITGYNYEPWHIRYVGSSEVAREITDKGLTLEEYLNKLPTTDVAPPAEEEETVEWTRTGYFIDEDDNILSILTTEDEDLDGWYVGLMIGDDVFGQVIGLKGDALCGNLNYDPAGEPFNVAVTEENGNGVKVEVEGGTTYHFKPIADTKFTVRIQTEGVGQISFAPEGDEPGFDDEYPVTSAAVNLMVPATYVFSAATKESGWGFIRWLKNGEDYSTDPIITVELTEEAEFVAVFEYVADSGQNPLMNFIGDYVSDRARATIKVDGDGDALISIYWPDSAFGGAKWVMSGPLDPDTLTVEYSDCLMSTVLYDENGNVKEETPVIVDGTGRIVFSDNEASFTWADDGSGHEGVRFGWAVVD